MNKFTLLQELGAGEFQHLNGSLESHLLGTENLLKQWGSSKTLQVAGLFHAAYGTSAFDEEMVSLTQRHEIAKIIGKDEEALVYLYCSCDRNYVFQQFGKSDPILFKDRFTGSIFNLTPDITNLFCELTVANELELVFTSSDFKAQYGDILFELFKRMDNYLSAAAKQAYRLALS